MSPATDDPRPPLARWGAAADLVPLTGGHRNLAFRTVGLPQDLVIKSTRRSAAAIRWLMLVQDRARSCGFIVPKLMPGQDGALVQDGWTCEAFVAGAPPPRADMPAILPRIEAFHRATANLPQRPGFLSAPELLTAPAGGDIDLNAMPPDLAALCRSAWAAVANGPQAVVHGDLNPSNLLRCPDGRIALIDWDECRRDLTLFDLGQVQPVHSAAKRALLAWEVACSWLLEPDHARSLVKDLHG